MPAYKSLYIELIAKDESLVNALNEAQSKAKATGNELKKMQKQLKLDPGNTKLLVQQQEQLRKQIGNTAKELEALYKVRKQGIDENWAETHPEQWEQLNNDIAVAESKLGKFKEQMRDLSAQIGAAESKLGKAGAAIKGFGEKLDPVGQKMQSIGRGMTTHLTLPIVGAATASVKAATDIDTALTNVRKTVDGTEEQYAALKDAAIEFSKANATSAEDFLNAEALGAQLGFNIGELQKFAEVATGLDIATDMDLETAGSEMARFANITGMTHDKIGNYASAIVEVGNSMATTESEVSSMAMRIAAAGTQVGLSQADILGLAGALSSLGVEAEAGGTAVSTIMSSIDKAVATNSDSLSTWAKTARMSTDEFASAWKEDAASALTAVLSGMAEAVDEGGNMSVILDELGISSLRQTDIMKRMAGNSGLMAEGIAIANRGWDENVALSNEVANRNDSLAAKFEMLRNRLVAVADSIGRPLADALFEAVDAAEPLFEAIESGARAFSDMSDDEQRAVVQTVALIAALGPALTLFGKAASSVKVLGGAMSSLSGFLAQASMAIGKVPKGVAEADAAMVKMATRSNLASAAMSAAKGAAIGLAVAGIAVLATAIADYVRKQEEFANATDGLEMAAARLKDGFSGVGGAIDAQGASVDAAAQKYIDFGKVAEEQATKGADLAKSMGSAFEDADAKAALVGIYSGKIAELAGNVGGSAGKLAELQEAVEQYNSLTGDSVSIVDEYSGMLDTNTASLRANADAVKANAYVKASEGILEEAVKRQISLENDLKDATDQVSASRADAAEAFVEWTEAAQSGSQSAEMLEQAYWRAEEQARKDEEAVASLTGQYESSKQAVEDTAEAVAKYARDAEDAKDEAEKLRSGMEEFSSALAEAGEGGEAFSSLAESIGLKAEDLAKALSEAGIGAQDLGRLGSDGFSTLYKAADGNISAIRGMLSALDALSIGDKHFEVTDDGTIVTESGHVIDLKNMTIDDKPFAVVCDSSDAESKIESIQNEYIPNKWFSIFAEDYASSILGTIKSNLDSIKSKTVGVQAFFGRASGGLSAAPIRAVGHASGGMWGIVDRPTLTNVGLVGEAGAEAVLGNAIIPLTNKRYVRPFAQAVASEMGAASKVVNLTVNLDYSAGDDAASMARDIASRLNDYMSMEA